MSRLTAFALLTASLPLAMPALAADDKIVVAHRGASGYLPEHTLAAKAMAHALGADYLEQDVVMTRDDALVVMHDLTLERTTDVEERFPERAREDGHFYVVDFTLDELRQLMISEPVVVSDGETTAEYPTRFPPGQSRFRLHTLAEEIELIQGLNGTTGREAGLYVELKSPRFHHREGKDLASAVLKTLKTYGYRRPGDKVLVQSFDPRELKRLDDELMPALAMQLPLVQLIAETEWGETQVENAAGELRPYDYGWMTQPGGMARIAEYAEGVGPWVPQVLNLDQGELTSTGLVERAHEAGLVVHPYTLRADRLPDGVGDFTALLEAVLYTAGADGVFSDHPDQVRDFLGRHADSDDTPQDAH